MIHRVAPGSSASFSHFNIAQNTAAVKRDDKAYTSPSVALNQNESENVYASAPTAPDPKIAHLSAEVGSFVNPPEKRRARCVILQNKKRIVNELLNADNELAAKAAHSGVANTIRPRAKSINKGAPGG